jgi:DNA-binding SARP family transcriptional activator
VARLSIRLLGPFDVTLDGEPVTGFASDKVRALLAYLAMTPDRAHRREALAGLLWPNYPERSARASLRNALGNLRRSIFDHDASPSYLIITRQTIQFNRDCDYWLDAAEFSSLLATKPATSEALEQAAALCRGAFLHGLSTPASGAFEEWLRLTREQISRQVGDVLRMLLRQHMERGAFERALPYALQQVELDPWDEDARSQLMQALARSGQRKAALNQYESLRQALASDLGIDPGPDTTLLYEKIRDGEIGASQMVSPLTPGTESAYNLPNFLVNGGEHAQLPVFVARQRELRWLKERLDGALAGEGQVIFVTGGAGQGKSSLLKEFSLRSMARQKSLLVALGSCNSFRGMGDPYLPFREILAMLTGDAEASWAAGTITRDHALRLWNALPSASQALVDHGPHVAPALIPCQALLDRAAAAAPGGASWFQQLSDRIDCGPADFEVLEGTGLLQQVTNFLRALAKERPLLLLLDDLQWADAATASLLFHLGRRLAGSRILLACAYRPEELQPHRADAPNLPSIPHPMHQVLDELQRQFGDITLDLDLVQEPEGRHFVESLLDFETNRLGMGFRSALFAHTQGHPLFTVELLRAMQERGDLVLDQSGAWVEGSALDWTQLPPRVEGIIRARLGRLSGDLLDLLSVASVEGEVFTIQVLARVQGLSERQALRLLSRELEAHHHLVREHSLSTIGTRRLARYRFGHALFQQHLYRSLGEGERALLHGEIASALEALYEEQIDEIAVALAHHYSQAHNHAKARRYLTLAGDLALVSFANQEAEGYYRQALELQPADTRRIALFTGLGEALARQNRFKEAIATWRKGIEYTEVSGNGDAVARLYARSAWAARQASAPDQQMDLCLEGLARVGEAPDGPGLVHLLRETARAYGDRALREEGEPYGRRALAMAERLGDAEAQAYTLAGLIVDPRASKEESLARAIRAVELAEANGLMLIGLRAYRTLAFTTAAHGDLRSAREYCIRGAALARRAGFASGEIRMLTILAHTATRLGNFQEAGESLSRARQRQEDLGESARVATRLTLEEIWYFGHLGEWSVAAELARTLQDQLRSRAAERDLADAAMGLGWAVLESLRLGSAPHAGSWLEAETALSDATEIFDRSLSPQWSVITGAQLGRLCLSQKRVGEARRLLAQVRERERESPRAWITGPRQWLEAHLAAAAGQWTEALERFETAAETYGDSDLPWWWARVLLDWADACGSTGRPDDSKRARALLRKAEQAFEEMGVKVYARVARIRLRGLEMRQK